MEAVIHQLPKVAGYSTRTSADKAAAKAADKETHAELRALRSSNPMNKSCADCTATLSGWASLPHGVFLCIGCAQVHRSLGRHMAQVKSFSSGTYLWYPDEVAAMRLMGNENANALYASPEKGAPAKPDKDAPAHIKDNYIRDKYQRLKWVDPDFTYSSRGKKMKNWAQKGKERFIATSKAVKSWKNQKASVVKSPSLSSDTILCALRNSNSSANANNSKSMTFIDGQPKRTSAVYGGGGYGGVSEGKSLLDDDRSTHGCLAPVLSGLSTYNISRSKWTCNRTMPSGATRAASTSPNKDDFFASWGL